MWDSYIKGFKAFLRLEKSNSENTISAYVHDVEWFESYAIARHLQLQDITLADLQDFVQSELSVELATASQARIISGLKTFFKYLYLEEVIVTNPSELLKAPKKNQYLPSVLSVEEIVAMIEHMDMSKPEATRNRAIIETLYSTGVRVSELVNLNIVNLFLDVGYIKVIGKGNKERLVPIGDEAVKQIDLYRAHVRNRLVPKKGAEDILFLNRNGGKLSRVMIFYIIRNAAAAAGIQKKISPHTMRHSFATHLIEGGAHLRAVQEMLGHENIITTEMYTHLDRRFLRETLEKFHPKF